MTNVQFLESVREHPYTTIVTVAFFEGRISSVVAAAFAAQGYLNPVAAYVIFVAMTILGDGVFYCLGCFGASIGRWIICQQWPQSCRGLQDRISSKLCSYENMKMEGGLIKILVLGKMFGIVSKPAILVAGSVRMPFYRFASIIIVCTLVFYMVAMSFGYFFSHWVF